MNAVLLRLRSDLAALEMRWALTKLAYKYNFDPAQPRVPAGNPDGGQWTRTGGNGLVRVAANEPEKPAEVLAIPMYGVDPLDPKVLNKLPPTPGELAEAQKALNAISRMSPEEIIASGKGYNNYPDRETGAVLPPSATGYLSFPVGSRYVSAKRLVIDTSTGAVYYTNNHYRSFYHFNLGK